LRSWRTLIIDENAENFYCADFLTNFDGSPNYFAIMSMLGIDETLNI